MLNWDHYHGEIPQDPIYTREALQELQAEATKNMWFTYHYDSYDAAMGVLFSRDLTELKKFFTPEHSFVFLADHSGLLRNASINPNLCDSDELLAFLTDIAPINDVYDVVNSLLLNNHYGRAQFLLNRVPDPQYDSSQLNDLTDGRCVVLFVRNKMIRPETNEKHFNKWFQYLMFNTKEEHVRAHLIACEAEWHQDIYQQVTAFFETYWSNKTKTVLIDAVKDIDSKLPHIKRKI